MFVSMRMSMDKHGTPFSKKAKLSGEPAPAQMSRKKGCLKSRTDCRAEATREEAGGKGPGMDSVGTGAKDSVGLGLSGAEIATSGSVWLLGDGESETDRANSPA